MRPQAEHRRLPEPLGEGRGNRAATAATPGRAVYPGVSEFLCAGRF
jgi:hypothetical protein